MLLFETREPAGLPRRQPMEAALLYPAWKVPGVEVPDLLTLSALLEFLQGMLMDAFEHPVADSAVKSLKSIHQALFYERAYPIQSIHRRAGIEHADRP
jgi:hypothetical protein